MAKTDAGEYYAFYTWCVCKLLSSVGWAKVDMALTNDWLLQWCFQEAYREEQLINRLMRQSQQERRIAVQLMHVRHEKEVLWQNRIFREKQYEERRLKDFQDALDREAVNNTLLSNPSKVSFDPFYHIKVNRAPFRCQSFHESVFLNDLSIISLFLFLYSYTNGAHKICILYSLPSVLVLQIFHTHHQSLYPHLSDLFGCLKVSSRFFKNCSWEYYSLSACVLITICAFYTSQFCPVYIFSSLDYLKHFIPFSSGIKCCCSKKKKKII